MRIEGRLSERARVALEAAIEDSDLGVPGPVGRESPQARYGSRQQRLALPGSFSPPPGHEATFLFVDVVSPPHHADPGSSFSSLTVARSLQEPIANVSTTGANPLPAFVSYVPGPVAD